jgi:membrane-associated phospholipid phosphatase
MTEKSLQTFFAIYLPINFWLLALLYLLIVKDFSTAIFTVLGGIILRAVCEVIYFFYKKPRPYQKIGVEPPNSAILLSPFGNKPDSFPSAHAAVMFFGAFFLIFNSFYFLGSLGFLAAILTSYSRVKLLYHYPIDIFAGAALASVWLIFMAFVARM